MRQKKKVGFILGAVLIVSMLVAVGRAPTISMAVTDTSQNNVSLLNTQLIQMLIELIKQLQAQIQQLIAAKTNSTIQCGWCGDSCINWTGKDKANTYCANATFLTNASCLNVNGTCQITNTTTTPIVDIKVNSSDGPITVPYNSMLSITWTSQGAVTCDSFGLDMPLVSGGSWIVHGGSGLSTSGTALVYARSNVTTANPITGTVELGVQCWNNITGASVLDGQDKVTINVTTAPACTLTASFSEGIDGAPANNLLVGGYKFAVAAAGGTPPYTYEWSNDGKQNMDSNVAYYKANNVAYYNWSTQGEKTVYAIVRDSVGCITSVSRKVTITTPTAPSSCIDSDGGKNYAVKGTTTNSTATISDACVTDNSGNLTNLLYEYYCDGYTIRNETYNCGTGNICQDGACKLATTVKPTVFISGLTYLDVNQSSTYIANVTGGVYPYSFIWSTDGLMSSYSDSNVGNYKWIQSGSHTINVKVTDSKGATVTGNLMVTVNSTTAIPASTITCIDTDGGNALADDSKYYKGTITIKTAAGGQWSYTDYCQSSTALQEYSCLSNPSSYPDSNASNAYLLSYYTCPSGFTCTDGACRSISVTTTTTTASGCSWCGRQCIASSFVASGLCSDVMPPTGSICSMVNGQCTAVGGAVQGVETHIFSENLSYGMESDDVKELQSVLAIKGYFSGTISGYFGWQTEEAVKAFQAANNLSATGYVGPLTRELLNS